MFDFFKAIILGVVEGITEFLPISSTGHLIIVNRWIYFSQDFTRMFDVVIQLGAIFAVIFYFRKQLWPFSHNKEKQTEVIDLWKKTIVGVIPAIILGALLGDFIEKKLFGLLTVALALIIGGILLIIIEKRKKESKIFSIAKMSYKTALLVGLIQCLAMIPGVSRSAATIIGAMLLGASRLLAVQFSFFLAIPTMVAASGYSLLKYGMAMSGRDIFILLTGFVVSFLVAWAVIAFLIKYIQRKNFTSFGYYRIVLGLLVLSLLLLK